MKTFNEIKVGQVFTLERRLKNNPHQPTLWRKQSSRTAALASGYRAIIGRPAWFYFSGKDNVYPTNEVRYEKAI